MTTSVSSTTSSSASSGNSATTAAANPLSQLNANDFLSLLTAQLSNQDPTQPVDNTQMVAQLAQFSSLAAANQTNTDLSTISGQITTLDNAATGTTTGSGQTTSTTSTTA